MDMKKIEELFEKPSKEYRGKPFWAWNGKLEKGELLRQIDIMKKMGFGGFFMHSRTGLETKYLGEDWFSLTNDCADYGDKEDMESWLYDEDRWPSGSAGGIVTQEEKFRSMFLVMNLYSKENLGSCDWNKQIAAIFACRLQGSHFTKERVWNLGDSLYDGETVAVFHIRYSECKDVYNGCAYLDTMNREGVERYIEVTHDKYLEKCKERIGTAIKGIFTDEPHRGALFSSFSEGREHAVPYTPVLFGEFEKRFGYDLKLHLLELFLVKEENGISKVTRDYIELCQELFIENFAKPIQKWCQDHHMIFTGHVLHEDSLTAQTVMQGSLMRFYEYMDYPGVDVLSEGNECLWIVKQVASVARQLDKEWVLSELYGCTGWQMNLEAYKNIGIWQALFGINLRCPHLSWYTMKGEAKRDYPASIFHQSSWYEEYRYVEDYFSRIHVALAEGKSDCSLLVLNPIESVWARAYSGAFDGLTARDKDIRRLEEQYTEVFRRLVHKRIDFDYGEEDILARHGQVKNGTLILGKCTYTKVLVAGMDTMRSSTLALLEAFVGQGGKLIFAGEVPGYVDVLPSKRVIQLAKQSISMSFKEDFERACCSGNEVLVEGEAGKDIFAQVRLGDKVKIAFLLNMNRNTSYQAVTICLGDGKSAELWDAKTGRRSMPGQELKNDKLYLTMDFAKGEEKLLVISKEEREVPSMRHTELRAINTVQSEYKYKLSEKNICVLDMVTVTTDQGEVIKRQEVLKADRRLRDKLNISYRGGEMLQPWYELKHRGADQKLCGVSLKYDFETDTPPQELQLVVEDLEHITELYLNGVKIEKRSIGKWIDICFDILFIPEKVLLTGENVLEIRYDYYKTCGIEAVYLLGDFGVTFSENGSKPILTNLPEVLQIGDITGQGLPFYSGKLSYRIEGVEGKHVVAKVKGYEGSCVKLIGGEEEKLIAWAPYEEEIDDLREVQVILTRRNTFGPLHQLPVRAAAYGPDNFMTTGKDWSDPYVLLPQGLLEVPEFYEKV